MSAHPLRAAALAAALLVASGVGAAPRLFTEQPVAIAVEARPITDFEIRRPEHRDFGRLRFLGGLELSSSFRGFGGLSGVVMRPDGSGFVAVADTGYWLEASLRYAGLQPVAVEDARMGPVLDRQGRPLASIFHGDLEALAGTFGKGPEGDLLVSIERRNRILSFAYGRRGMAARGTDLPRPEALDTLPYNRGVEALALIPEGLPDAGARLAVAEEAPGGVAQAWLLRGPKATPFRVQVGEGWAVTDAVALPSGEILLLCRRYAPMLDIGMRISSIPAAEIENGATLEPTVLVTADLGFEIDNLEALGAHRTADGRTVLTLLSDDNYSILQRTLLLQFELRPDPAPAAEPNRARLQ